MAVSTLIETWQCYGAVDGSKSSLFAGLYFFQKYVLRRRYFSRKIHDYRMQLDLHDPGISKTLAIIGKRELEHRFILQSELRPGMTVWDLGANLGYYALMEAEVVGPEGRVYAVEPVPANCDLLKRNVELNHREDVIEVFQMAISDRNGEADFHLSEMSNTHTFHPLSYRSGKPLRHLSGKTLRVKTVDVPSFLQGKRPVDLVRMDIEGHEVEVFGSIIEAVNNHDFAARILFETHFPRYDDAQHNMRAQLQRLFDAGYYPKWMATNDDRNSSLRAKGYSPHQLVHTDGVVRGLYQGVGRHDALELVCDLGGVRTVLLERRP